MKTKAAVLFEQGEDNPWQILELDLADPGPNQVLIRYVAAGLCHSDLHVQLGDLKCALPIIGGHEGAGVIEKVGPGVTRVAEGDHVVCAFIPSCGHCRFCATGQQNLCDVGAGLMDGYLPGDVYPATYEGRGVAQLCMLGTFSQYGVLSEMSCVTIDKDLPLETAVLCGCGVPTGWGSAVNSADVQVGDTVVVFGIGGIGSNAVQGASHAGAMNIIAVDPKANKREFAQELGATHTAENGEQAIALAQKLTDGAGADSAIVTVDLVTEQVVTDGHTAIRKGGSLVLTGVAHLADHTISLPSNETTLFRKHVKGSLFGDCNPTQDIKRMLSLYRAGKLKLDELITARYSLEQVNQGYEDLVAGKNIRGVIIHEH